MAINSNLALKTSPANNSSISANLKKTSTQQANTSNSNKTGQQSVSPSTSKPSSTASFVPAQQTTSKSHQTSQSNTSNNTTYNSSGKAAQNSQPSSVNIVSNSNNSAVKVNTSNTQSTQTGAASSNQTLLKNGSKGEEVKQLQQALVNAGYNIKVDGIYGKQTEAAVKEYQQKNGLKVDGLAGKQTKGSLGLASNTSTSSNVSAKATAPTSQTVLGNTSSAASKPMVQNTSASVSPKKSTQQNTPTSNTGANAGTAKQNTAPVNNNTNIAVPITSLQNNPVYSQPKTTSNYQQTAQANVQASKTQPEAVSKAQGAISKSNTVNEQPKTVDNKAEGVYNDSKTTGGSKANEGKIYQKGTGNVTLTMPVSSNITKSEFVAAVYEAAKVDEAKTGVPAEITTAQAILESRYGKSVPTDINNEQYSYNLFGIKGSGPAGSVTVWTTEYVDGKKIKITADFKTYNNFKESIEDHSEFLMKNKRYKSLFESDDPVVWAKGLQKARYATDPEYANKLIGIMKAWKLIK